MKKNKTHHKWLTIVLIIVFAAGILLILYPTIADSWNGRKQAKVVADYEETVSAMTEKDRDKMLKRAKEYNDALYRLGSSSMLSDPEQLDGYWYTLNVEGSGIMGYVSIDKLNVKLPIYHGTDPHTLSEGAGHLEGSSLPVGGESTHSVIVAHRGLPSSKMFTDLDEMEVGDIFTVTVLNEVSTYIVDKITVVLPDELEELYIESGEDYCTLLTCTPYGINTHRLLVRGVKTDTEHQTAVLSDAKRINSIIAVPVLAVAILILVLILLIISTRKKKLKSKDKNAGV